MVGLSDGLLRELTFRALLETKYHSRIYSTRIVKAEELSLFLVDGKIDIDSSRQCDVTVRSVQYTR